MPSCDILGSSRNVFTLGFVCVHVETKSLRINPSPTSGQDSRIFLSGLVFFFLSFFLSFFLFLGSFSYFFFFFHRPTAGNRGTRASNDARLFHWQSWSRTITRMYVCQTYRSLSSSNYGWSGKVKRTRN